MDTTEATLSTSPQSDPLQPMPLQAAPLQSQAGAESTPAPAPQPLQQATAAGEIARADDKPEDEKPETSLQGGAAISAEAESEPAKEDSPAKNEADLTKVAAGTFHPKIFDGVPVDAAKRFVLARAGVKPQHSVHQDVQPLSLTWLPALGGDGKPVEPDVPRLPSPFSLADYAGPLVSVADWLAAFDAFGK